MSWENIVDGTKDFFNQPVPIIGVSVGLLFLFALVIFSKTSLGKKTLNFLKNGFEETKKEVASAKKEFVEFKEKLIKETEEKINSMKEYYESEKKKEEAKIAILEKACLLYAEYSHNDKIKEVMEETKSQLLTCKNDFDFMIEEKAEEVKASFEEKYENEMKHYKEEVDKVIAEVKKVAETSENKAKMISDEVDGVKEHIENEVKEVIDEVKVNE